MKEDKDLPLSHAVFQSAVYVDHDHQEKVI